MQSRVTGRRLTACLAGAALVAVVTAPAALPREGAKIVGNAKAGAAVFKANCISCHALKAARASSTIGPNLDKKKPAYALVIARVTKGKGVMPPYGSTLSKAQIQNVAAYVYTSTHK